MRSRRTRVLLAVFSLGFVLANAVAFMQARAMTHFVAEGVRTKPPEESGWLQTAKVILAGVCLPRPRDSSTPAELELPSETRRFSRGANVTLEAWYVPGNDNLPLVVAFHGYGASKASLLPSARLLHGLGYAVLLVDFYGSGGSSGTGTSLGFLESRDVAAATAYARAQWPGRRIVLYGFSMGGAAILRAIATEGAKPDAVILEATFDTLRNAAKNRFHTLGLPGSPFAELLLFWGGVQEGFNPFNDSPVTCARFVTCPTLMLQGGQDARVLLSQAGDLHRALGERSTLRVYPGVPHVPLAGVRPVEWTRDVRAFLGGCL
jgi:alpha-beta hydrolase superfamily lysophospholipase